jgi:peptidoglycan-N-acetylmuramic acid deacetylase
MAKTRKSVPVTTVCKNHPDKKTRRRCYQCKEYICSACIIRYDHHFFCSQDCIRQYENQSRDSSPARTGKGKQKKTPASAPKRLIRVTFSDMIFILFIVLLSIFLYQQWQKNKDNTPTFLPEIREIAQDSSWKPVIYGNHLEIHVEGKFPANKILTVWINNIFHKTLTSPGNLKIPFTSLLPGENNIQINAVGPDTVYTVYKTSFLISRPDLKRLDYSVLPGNRKWIALTFDAGSNDGALDSIIAILNRYDIRATAFLTGMFIIHFPDKVKKLVRSGRFDFGNHSFSHPHLTTYAENHRHETLSQMTFPILKKELIQTDSLFYRISGFHLSKIWRAPYGEYNTEILHWAGLLGYVHIGWTPGFDTFDWVKDTSSSIYYTPDALWEKWKDRFEKNPLRFRGAIVLMHLGNERIKPIYPFLHQFIPFMQKKGYTFVTIPQILHLSNLARKKK